MCALWKLAHQSTFQFKFESSDAFSSVARTKQLELTVSPLAKMEQQMSLKRDSRQFLHPNEKNAPKKDGH
jgi:hypothetical protein